MCDVYSMVDGADGDEEERSGGSGGNWSRRLLQTAGTMQRYKIHLHKMTMSDIGHC